MEILKEAIKTRKLVKFLYEGEERIVAPHTLGENSGNLVLRAFQKEGYSSSGKLGWRLYIVSKMDEIEKLEAIFEQEVGYKKGDKIMNKIIAEL